MMTLSKGRIRITLMRKLNLLQNPYHIAWHYSRIRRLSDEKTCQKRCIWKVKWSILTSQG